MITLNEISKKIPGRVLFENVTISFNEGNRYALTGPNGAGKSTLLKIIMGSAEATSGSVSLPKRTGFLRQDIESYAKERVIDTVIMANKRLWGAFQERDSLYEGEITDSVGIRLGELEEIIVEENGYGAEAFLIGMGIEQKYHEELMGTIPTDLQFRVMLCQALFGNPEALLLDEPTNHLDLESIGWLENFLKEYVGTLVVVSHDRHFLNAITTHIADIDYETLIIYPGNYDSMVLAKSAVRERVALENKAKEKKASQLQEFVKRFSAGTRASQVKSRMKEIKRLEPQELKKSNIQRPYIRFYPPETASGQRIFRVKKIEKSYAGPPVISGFSCEILRGEKVGVVGNNGRGKTTFLKMLAEKLTPDEGSIERGHQVSCGYFPQNHDEVVDKTSHETIFEWLKGKRAGIYDQDVRSILGKMLFSGEDAFKPISHLSGGETARLILGGLMLCNYNTLILDEPNNHLDLESVSALSWALENFPGTLIVVTHDRSLIEEVTKKLIVFEETGPRMFEGSITEYLAK